MATAAKVSILLLKVIVLSSFVSSLRQRLNSIFPKKGRPQLQSAALNADFESVSNALIVACDERWQQVIQGGERAEVPGIRKEDLKVIDYIAALTTMNPSFNPTINWGRGPPPEPQVTTPVSILTQDQKSVAISPIDGAWKLRFSTHPDTIRRARKYLGSNIYEVADSRGGTIASIVSFNESHKFRRELRKVNRLDTISANSLKQRLCKVEVFFRPPLLVSRLTLPVPWVPQKRANNVVEVLYVDDDYLLTKEEEFYSVRTKLHQAWDPGSPTGWVYISGV
jgi:hypothetical protein